MTTFDHSVGRPLTKRAGWTLLAAALLMALATPVFAQRAPPVPAVPQGEMGAGTESRMWADPSPRERQDEKTEDLPWRAEPHVLVP